MIELIKWIIIFSMCRQFVAGGGAVSQPGQLSAGYEHSCTVPSCSSSCEDEAPQLQLWSRARELSAAHSAAKTRRAAVSAVRSPAAGARHQLSVAVHGDLGGGTSNTMTIFIHSCPCSVQATSSDGRVLCLRTAAGQEHPCRSILTISNSLTISNYLYLYRYISNYI